MRRIGVVTGARSDYGLYRPLLAAIRADPQLRLQLIVAGMHFAPEFGRTITEIEADGFEVAERVEMLLASDTPAGIAKSMGLAVIGYAQAYGHLSPELLVVSGDRFEMHAAALAALPFKIPVVHIHGGEVTRGSIDDALRHSMTKLSHIHFVSTHDASRRVLQLGEEPWRVIISGALSLDNVRATPLLSLEQLRERHEIRLDPPFLLVTFHPVTLEFEEAASQTTELLAAVDASGLPALFTMPNGDTGGSVVRGLIQAFVSTRPAAQLVPNLGTQGYLSAMHSAAAMVGNSSSGIVEALSFHLPVVNVGTRQDGRARTPNIIDAGYGRGEILAAIRKAVAPHFRANLIDVANPYGDGHAASRIVQGLKTVELNEALLLKRFIDAPNDGVQLTPRAV